MTRRRLLVLIVGLAVGVAGPSTVAAFSDSGSRPGSSITAIPDWVAPPINSAQVLKSQGGKAGYVRPSGSYYLCADIGSDSGNPASGLQSITSNLSQLTSTLVGQVLGLLSGSPPCSSSLFNRISGPHTVNQAAGTKSITLTTKDNANNTDSVTRSVVVDGTAPTASNSFSITNGGATAGKAEQGDVVTFTFSEPIDPESIVSGWDGSARSDIFVRVIEGGGAGKVDQLDLWRLNGASYVQPPLIATGSSLSLGGDYTSATAVFSGSTMTASGNNVTVTLGTVDAAGPSLKTVTANTTMSWPTSSTLFDWAGNTLGASTISEGGTADKEF